MKITRLGMYSLALGAFALAITGCGGKKTNRPKPPHPAPAASAPAGKTVDPATAGELTGTVKLDGTPPKMKTISTAAEPACGKTRTTPLTSEEVVTGDGGSLANVVVYIKSGLEGYSFPAPSDAREIYARGMPVSSPRRRNDGRPECGRHQQ